MTTRRVKKKGTARCCALANSVTTVLARDFHCSTLVGAESQQCRNPADAVELLVVGDVNNLDATADRVTNDGVADIFEFGVLLPANHTRRSDVHIHVAAVETLHARRQKIRAEKQRLHLADFQRAQHAPQTDSAASIAMRLANHFADQPLLYAG